MSPFPQVRLKRSVRLRSEKSAGQLPYIGLEHVESWTGSSRPVADSGEFELEGARAFEPGDVLFGKLRPYLAKALVAGTQGSCSPEFLILQPRFYEARYLCYLLLTPGFIDQVNSTTYGAKMPRSSWDDIAYIACPRPPMPLQVKVADFLDEKTRDIDGVIKAKHELLRLLREKRISLIKRMVTRGLDPSAPVKDTRIPWIGKIPKTWQVLPARWATTAIKTGGTPPTGEASYFEEGDVPWFAPASFSPKSLRLGAPKGHLRGTALAHGAAPAFKKGAVLVVGIGATLGRVGLLQEDGTGNQQVLALEFPVTKFLPEYAAYQFKYREAVFMGQALFTTLPIMNQHDMGNHAVICPPLPEQVSICAVLDRSLGKIELAEQRIGLQISRLQEYRQALVAAAVSGQLTVEEAARR